MADRTKLLWVAVAVAGCATEGEVGPQGPEGLPGADGVHCWDLDESGTCDLASEDVDESGACDVADCSAAEHDPLYSASAAADVTPADLDAWDSAVGWGDHAAAGYLTGESDPSFAASPAAAITSEHIDGWTEAAGWGDHSEVGYLTSEADPLFGTHVASGITTDLLDRWNAAWGWGDHGGVGYLTDETDPDFAAAPAADITDQQILDWEAAYDWGNHADYDYLTAESDPVVATTAQYAPCTGTGTKVDCDGSTWRVPALGSATENGEVLADVVDAVTSAGGAALIQLEAGDYATDNVLLLPDRVAIVGAGVKLTSLSAPQVDLGMHCELRDLSFVHTLDALGGEKVGIRSDASPSFVGPRIKDVWIRQDGAVDATAIHHQAGFLVLDGVRVSSNDGYGIEVVHDLVEIDASRFEGVNSLDVGADGEVEVAFTKLEGDVSVVGTARCFDAYDGNLAALDGECQPAP